MHLALGILMTHANIKFVITKQEFISHFTHTNRSSFRKTLVPATSALFMRYYFGKDLVRNESLKTEVIVDHGLTRLRIIFI